MAVLITTLSTTGWAGTESSEVSFRGYGVPVRAVVAGVASGTILQLGNCRQEHRLRSKFEAGCSLKIDLEF